MPDDLLPYYERELAFMRRMGAEFARTYPKIAGNLLLEGGESEDPHVERLLQGFALLAGRIHHKLDDEFPEITDALLSVLYPHYLAPIPSMSIVQFDLDPAQGKLTTGYRIAPGTSLDSQRVNGLPCRFRTCYPLTLWPLTVASARLETPERLGSVPQAAMAVIRLELHCQGGATLAELALDRLRFFLHGEGSLAYTLYELLCNNTCQVQLRPLGSQSALAPLVLSPECLRPVGFAPDEGLLPYTPRSFLGYRLLQEYFTFPEKFLFCDVAELDRAGRAGFEAGLEICILLDRMPRLEQPITKDTFRLGCTPIINLFEQVAEPLRLSQTQTEYRIVPDVRHPKATEVYSVDTVTSWAPGLSAPLEFAPFYARQHAAERGRPQAFWHASRRLSHEQGDTGTDVYLSLVDLHFRPTLPAVETLMVHTTCTNRDLPARLPFGGESGDFMLEEAAPVRRIRCLKKPTRAIRPALRRGAQWRLISHLSLNYLSICEGGREALQEILTLYDFADSAVVRQQIEGITDVRSRRVVARPASLPWNGFCRGIEVTMAFDEEKYVGSGVFLFASVLEKFLGLYASLNSFTQLIAVTQQRERPVKQWPPRAGEQILL